MLAGILLLFILILLLFFFISYYTDFYVNLFNSSLNSCLLDLNLDILNIEGGLPQGGNPGGDLPQGGNPGGGLPQGGNPNPGGGGKFLVWDSGVVSQGNGNNSGESYENILGRDMHTWPTPDREAINRTDGLSNPWDRDYLKEDPVAKGWKPFDYGPNVREDGRMYNRQSSIDDVIATYNPRSGIPPMSEKQLGVLVDYRFENGLREQGFNNWTVDKLFPYNNLVDKTARERLFTHIYNERASLVTAYREMNIGSGAPQWKNVRVTAYLINSLNRGIQ